MDKVCVLDRKGGLYDFSTSFCSSGALL